MELDVVCEEEEGEGDGGKERRLLSDGTGVGSLWADAFLLKIVWVGKVICCCDSQQMLGVLVVASQQVPGVFEVASQPGVWIVVSQWTGVLTILVVVAV